MLVNVGLILMAIVFQSLAPSSPPPASPSNLSAQIVPAGLSSLPAGAQLLRSPDCTSARDEIVLRGGAVSVLSVLAFTSSREGHSGCIVAAVITGAALVGAVEVDSLSPRGRQASARA
jgi:hypothetical protein